MGGDVNRRAFLATSTAGLSLLPLAGASAGVECDVRKHVTCSGFDTGLRRLHVSSQGAMPLDGTKPDGLYTTLQAAINEARPGDVVTVAAGVYREQPEIKAKAGTRSLPLWIVAEQRGAVTISGTWREAEQGDVVWTDEGGGVFSTLCDERPYVGEHEGDFLMAYLSEADLRAESLEVYSAISRKDVVIKKPPYGFAFASDERRVYIRLRDDADPNGQRIKLTGNFARSIVSVSHSDHIIIDGFVLEGAGCTRSIDFDDHCVAPTVRNCVFRLARFGVRCPSKTLLDTCTYHYVGFDRWTRDLFALDGTRSNGVFVLVKGYYNADAIGFGGGRGNALLEGSIDNGYSFETPQVGVVIYRCLIGPCFDGSRIGEFNESEIKNSVFLECRDDGFQNESPSGKPSANNRIHDCRFINCYHDASHQGDSISGQAFIYRNVFEWNDVDLAIPGNFSIKMISTGSAGRIYYYHNTWIIDYQRPLDRPLSVWADFGGPKSRADKIEVFVNNIVVMPHDLSDKSGPNPKVIASNAVVGPSGSSALFLVANGGVFAGTTRVDIGLDADHALTPSSPLGRSGRRFRKVFQTAVEAIWPNGMPEPFPSAKSQVQTGRARHESFSMKACRAGGRPLAVSAVPHRMIRLPPA